MCLLPVNHLFRTGSSRQSSVGLVHCYLFGGAILPIFCSVWSHQHHHWKTLLNRLLANIAILLVIQRWVYIYLILPQTRREWFAGTLFSSSIVNNAISIALPPDPYIIAVKGPWPSLWWQVDLFFSDLFFSHLYIVLYCWKILFNFPWYLYVTSF